MRFCIYATNYDLFKQTYKITFFPEIRLLNVFTCDITDTCFKVHTRLHSSIFEKLAHFKNYFFHYFLYNITVQLLIFQHYENVTDVSFLF